jgi:tetrahydromethanopterin S-methyltransferase subunit A
MEDFGFFLTRVFATTKGRRRKWPYVPGKYYVTNANACVAVTTLGNVELAEQVADSAPDGLCIVGKVETENIGIEKIIKNIISNPGISYLICAGNEPPKHLTGATLMALFEHGVDEQHRVINSPGMRPVLPNTSHEEIETFRKQVVPVDMIGCNEIEKIHKKIEELALIPVEKIKGKAMFNPAAHTATETITARVFDPNKIKLDKAGYFVIQIEDNRILVEHYNYKEKLLRTIEGTDARNIYLTILGNGWASRLDHAAYLGAQLMKAELAMKSGSSFTQDGA